MDPEEIGGERILEEFIEGNEIITEYPPHAFTIFFKMNLQILLHDNKYSFSKARLNYLRKAFNLMIKIDLKPKITTQLKEMKQVEILKTNAKIISGNEETLSLLDETLMEQIQAMIEDITVEADDKVVVTIVDMGNEGGAEALLDSILSNIDGIDGASKVSMEELLAGDTGELTDGHIRAIMSGLEDEISVLFADEMENVFRDILSGDGKLSQEGLLDKLEALFEFESATKDDALMMDGEGLITEGASDEPIGTPELEKED